jgi:hypothetical protein
MLALAEARAAVCVLEELASGDLSSLRESSNEAQREVAAWLNGWLVQVLRRCFDEAEAAFRKSLTSEQVHAQVVGELR